MIWKLLFIGFVLSNNRTNKILLLNSMPRNELSKRQRSNSEDINTTNETIGEIYNKSHRPFFYERSGYDERYNSSKDNISDHDVILNITKFYQQMELLKTLENKNVPQQRKLEYIEEYNKHNRKHPYLPDIFSGGLKNDWEFNL